MSQAMSAPRQVVLHHDDIAANLGTIKAFVAQGRTAAQAAAEVDGNIANGRRIFAADQETYIKTGKVPR